MSRNNQRRQQTIARERRLERQEKQAQQVAVQAQNARLQSYQQFRAGERDSWNNYVPTPAASGRPLTQQQIDMRERQDMRNRVKQYNERRNTSPVLTQEESWQEYRKGERETGNQGTSGTTTSSQTNNELRPDAEQFEEQQNWRDYYWSSKQIDRLYFQHETEEERRYFIGESIEYYNNLYFEYVLAEDPSRKDDIERQFGVLEYLFSLGLGSSYLNDHEPFDAHFSNLTRDLLNEHGIKTQEDFINLISIHAQGLGIDPKAITGDTGEEVLLRFLTAVAQQDTLEQVIGDEIFPFVNPTDPIIGEHVKDAKGFVTNMWLPIYESLDIDPAINISVVNWAKDHFADGVDFNDPVQVENAIRTYLIHELQHLEAQYGVAPPTGLLTIPVEPAQPIDPSLNLSLNLPDLPPPDYSDMSLEVLFNRVGATQDHANRIEAERISNLQNEHAAAQASGAWWEQPIGVLVAAQLDAPDALMLASDPRYGEISQNRGAITDSSHTLEILLKASRENYYSPPPDPMLLLLVAGVIYEPIDWAVGTAESIKLLLAGRPVEAAINAALTYLPVLQSWMGKAGRALGLVDNAPSGGVIGEIAEVTDRLDNMPSTMGGGPGDSFPEKIIFGRKVTAEDWYQMYDEWAIRRAKDWRRSVEEVKKKMDEFRWSGKSKLLKTPLGDLGSHWVAEKLEQEWGMGVLEREMIWVEISPGVYEPFKPDIIAGIQDVGESFQFSIDMDLSDLKVREVKTGFSQLSEKQKRLLVWLKERGADVGVIGENLKFEKAWLKNNGIPFEDNYKVD